MKQSHPPPLLTFAQHLLNVLHVLQGQPLQHVRIVRIAVAHIEAHKIIAGAQLQLQRPPAVQQRCTAAAANVAAGVCCAAAGRRHVDGQPECVGQLRRKLVGRLEERDERDVRQKVVRPVPAVLGARPLPEGFQLADERAGRTGVQDVLASRARVQRRIVNVRQQPVDGQLGVAVSGGGQRLLAANGLVGNDDGIGRSNIIFSTLIYKSRDFL